MTNGKELTASGFLKKLIGFYMASWLSAALTFFAAPISTRLYTPDQIGHINLFITYMTFFQTVCVLALDQGFMRFYNEKIDGLQKNNLLTYCLCMNMGLSAVSAVLIFINHHFFSLQIGGEERWLIPVCLSAAVICGTFLHMCSISSRMEGNVRFYTIQVVFTALVDKAAFAITAFWSPVYETAVSVITGGYVLLSIIVFFMKRKKSLQLFNHVEKSGTRMILSFSVPYLPVLLLSWLNSSIPLFILRKYVDYSSIGIYTSAVTISNVLSIIQTGFSAYWSSFIYEHYKYADNRDKIQKIVKLVVFVLIFTAISVVLLQDMVYLMIGERFRAGKLIFPFLMFTPICNCIGDMTGIGIMLSKKSYLNIITFVCCVSANFIVSFFLVPRIGIAGAAIAVGISALVTLIIRSFYGMKYYRVCDNGGVVFKAIILMICVSVINIVINGWQLKYFLIFSCLAGLGIVFRKEIAYLADFVLRLWAKDR